MESTHVKIDKGVTVPQLARADDSSITEVQTLDMKAMLSHHVDDLTCASPCPLSTLKQIVQTGPVSMDDATLLSSESVKLVGFDVFRIDKAICQSMEGYLTLEALLLGKRSGVLVESNFLPPSPGEIDISLEDEMRKWVGRAMKGYNSILDMDISGYGFYGETGFVPFLLAFMTGLPAMCLSVWLRLIQLKASGAAFCPCDAVVMLSMAASCGFLITMAVTNNNPDQSIHFPCALAGMGTLAVFEFSHAIYAVGALIVAVKRQGFVVLNMIRAACAVLYVVLPCLVPIFVYKWLDEPRIWTPDTPSTSPYEWTAVIFLFMYFLPLSLELGLNIHTPVTDGDSREPVLQSAV
uniref:Uncharacterized protein n=1 Tax=Chromera velia CCMP2878 TaxID=1169474 RepID=A0A0G4H421_9ALVE|eukprot:Cvel_24613.t1-p1 / transcript=Cvel_24613.t1 / gene=Cvel_24613 / organism=Chromera_velia_CCMP2878 / gene_product=hypothetical protein / transcript_product=hypothetical protein / location=Cvel_scaffold2683:924-11367(+) / protein_length=350 / sequence_SO=supercontig / SO=protein_coding / is_pseudo=false